MERNVNNANGQKSGRSNRWKGMKGKRWYSNPKLISSNIGNLITTKELNLAVEFRAHGKLKST
jgi:hypothetical protein